MGYEEVWKALADLLTELHKKGETIPADIMNDLRSAKTMIQVLKADPNHIENIPRIEAYLESVEFYAVFAAQEKIGTDYVEQWTRKLDEARRVLSEEKETTPKFVPGLPRGKRWIRVQVSDQTPRAELELLAKENKLSHKMQKNGYMLAYGSDENIKAFVKKIAEKIRASRKR